MPCRCLIVEDEPLARELMGQFVGQLPTLSLVASCADALTGLQVLQTQPVDLLFTDIKMPQLSGLDLVRALAQPPTLILTTAYSEYALDGFDIGAVDYLVKPFCFARFLRAVDRALDRNRRPEPIAPAATAPTTYLFLKVDRRIVKVFLTDVRYWQAYGNYVKVFFYNGQSLLVSETMTHLEKLLPTDQFVRIHKSYIVALPGITEYQVHSLSLGSVTLPIGELYRRQFMAAVK